MKIIILILLMVLISSNCFAGTLVKYNKNSGDIIQTNNIDEVPSQEFLANRFKTDDADVIFIDSTVDLNTQRVDVSKKKIVNIPKAELDSRNSAYINEKEKEKKVLESMRAKLKALGLSDEEVAKLGN